MKKGLLLVFFHGFVSAPEPVRERNILSVALADLFLSFVFCFFINGNCKQTLHHYYHIWILENQTNESHL